MLWYEELDRQLKDYLPDLRMEQEEPMSRHTSFRIGGPARRMAFPATGEQVVLLMNFARACGARPLVIGNGTNLLVPDEGLDRLVINTAGGLSSVGVEVPGRTLFAQSGASLARLADFALKNCLTGLEFAHGIPGTVGGALCMNAGAYGGEIRQVVAEATVLDPEHGVQVLRGEELHLSYRHSVFTDAPDWIALGASFHLEPDDPEKIRSKMEELMTRRRASQPLEYPSAGSTFKRPEGYYAGPLIEGCGLKGLTIGGAQVSQKHAGFLINRGGATFADVTALIAEVQRRVLEEKGIRLEPEVKIIR